MAPESGQGSASIKEAVAVRGGGIPLDATLHHSWTLYPEYVDGSRFVDIYTADYRCKIYFNHHFATVNHSIKLREAKVAELMRGLANEEDPNAAEISPSVRLYRPKRELIDSIPEVIELEVVTRNAVHVTVKVRPSWREKAVLQIELTQENMDLLLEEPPAESAPLWPRIEQPQHGLGSTSQPCAVHILGLEKTVMAN